MTHRQAGFAARRQATEQAKAQYLTPAIPSHTLGSKSLGREAQSPDLLIKAFHKIVWERGYPAWQKIQAVDELIAWDEDDFRQKAARRFGLLRNHETVVYLYQQAVSRKWHEFTAVAVLNYARHARGIAFQDRIEPTIIQKLNPGQPVRKIIFDFFAGRDDTMTYKQQVASWLLLNKLATASQLAVLLHQAPPTTPLVSDLQAAYRDLATLPNSREGLLWLAYMRDNARAKHWQAGQAAVARLNSEQKLGLQMRHMPVLVHSPPDVFSQSRTLLLAQLQHKVRQAHRYLKGPTYDGSMEQWPQTLKHWQDQLVWADLVSLHQFMGVLNNTTLARQLFRQADKDVDDPSTEYGGVIDLGRQNQLKALAFAPAYRKHDLKYIPSQKMINRLYTGLAHYHFHAQRYKNRLYAGPGLGDLRLANSLPAHYLVFTLIDRNHLNVDYYQRGKIVIDLGTIVRPGSMHQN